jgi:hypothetical protein
MAEAATQQQSQQGTPAAAAAAVVPPVKGTPEYNAMMAARFENQGGGEAAAAPVKPEGVPDKFWDAEKGEVRVAEMAKSYTELEKARAQQPAAKPDAKAATTPDPKTAAADAAAQDAVANAGLNWDDLGTKVATTGKLEDADYAALQKAGIPRNIVDQYISLNAGAVENARNNTFAYIGKGDAAKGKQQVEAALTWASQNLAADEIEFYNAQLATKNWKPALEQLITKMGDPTADEPNLIHGTGAGGEAGFASQYAMVEAMSKRNDRGQRLYDVDPAYRRSVVRRVALMK